MKTTMIDSHFHGLAMHAKGIDPVAAINAARENGVGRALEIGLHPSDLKKRIELFAGVKEIYYTSGLAPSEAGNDGWEDYLPMLSMQATSGGIVAIGEIGLDSWHWNYGTKTKQTDLLEGQLAIAKEAGLPVVIHNRDADDEMIAALSRADLPAAGIMHCFSSGYGTAKRCIDLGYMISFAGNVTYKNAQKIQDTARKIPESAVLMETDAPFLSPQKVRGTPNEPSHIKYTYEFVAELRGISPKDLEKVVSSNLASCLGLPNQEE